MAGTACDTKVDSWFHHRVRVQYRIVSEPNMPPTKGKAGKGRAIAPNIGERMLEVEQRVESLDAAIRQIHPEYAGPIVNRVTEIERYCREHANKVFTVLANQRDAVQQVVDDASKKAEAMVASLEKAAEHHKAEQAALRRELRPLEKMVEERAEQSSRNLDLMGELVRQSLENINRNEDISRRIESDLQRLSRLEAMASEMQICVQQVMGSQAMGSQSRGDGSQPRSRGDGSQRSGIFTAAVSRLQRRSLSCPTRFLGAIMEDAMQLAKSRSPRSKVADEFTSQQKSQGRPLLPSGGATIRTELTPGDRVDAKTEEAWTLPRLRRCTS